MRYLIIGLSVLFFILSGIITLKTSGLSAKNVFDQNTRIQRTRTEPENYLSQSAKGQAVDKAAMDEMQQTIIRLENQLSKKKVESQANDMELKSTISSLEEKLSSRDDESRADIQELHANIAMLEEKISGSEQQSGNDREAVKSRDEKILAVLGSGTFSSGQIVIDEHLVNVVKESVREISASPEHSVSIEGHTDNIPIKISSGRRYADNMDLSYLRAKTIAGILIKYGIPPEQISVIGYGDTRPIASNDTEEGRAKNRRVEIKLIPEKKEL
ncbi:MAG: OmpA family protein [Nitrospirota bacterium]